VPLRSPAERSRVSAAANCRRVRSGTAAPSRPGGGHHIADVDFAVHADLKDTTLRLLGSDDFSIASAHEVVERGTPGRVVLTIHS
jgi:hypothetical protein